MLGFSLNPVVRPNYLSIGLNVSACWADDVTATANEFTLFNYVHSDIRMDDNVKGPAYNDTRPAQLHNLGLSLLGRFQSQGELEVAYLDYAVLMLNIAVELTPTKHPDKPQILHNLGVALGTRFQRLGELPDIERAIAAYAHAVELTPKGNPPQPTLLHCLSIALRDRFLNLGDHRDLEESTAVIQRAIELTPDGHPEKVGRMCGLGCSLHDRFRYLGELKDLEQSIAVVQRAIELTPEGHPEKAGQLHSLGCALNARFWNLGELRDLEESIAVMQRALELTPEGHPEKAGRMHRLGRALNDRFRNLGELSDLEQSIAVSQRAIELTPDGHPEKVGRMCGLGCSLNARFWNLGELRDLEESIAVMQRALELTPEGHPEKAGRMHRLGCALNDRFRNLGELRDLEQSIAVMQRALELTPEGHPEKAGHLHNLGCALRDRFGNLGELRDLEQSIAVMQRVIELTPEGHPEKARQLHNLGCLLNDRFRNLGEPRDLEQSIAVMQRAIELTPDGHPEKAARLHALGCLLHDHFCYLGELGDLEESIIIAQRAIKLTPEGHPTKARQLYNLGLSLNKRYRSLGEVRDLEESIALAQRAMELTPKGHPDEVWRNISLVHSYTERFKRDPNRVNFDATLSRFAEATTRSTGSVSMRWDSAQRCIRFLLDDCGEFGSADLLLLAHSRALDLLPAIVWLGHGLERRYHECAKIGSAVSDAVHTAVLNDALPHAIGWLEAGRAFVWFQLLSLRMPIDDLKEQHPDLAESLERVSKKLRHSGNPSSHDLATSAPTLGYSTDAAADRHRWLAIQYDETLCGIRRCSGFEDFMRSPKLDGLLPALELTDGPVVFINVNPLSCDAVVLCSDGTISRIALPQLTERRAQHLRALWTRQLGIAHTRVRRAMAPEWFTARGTMSIFCRILERLWTCVVQPILERLNLIKQAPSKVSHITWCPTGPLTQLPLHAAGIYDTEQKYRPHTYDFVASSYTPSLSVILQNSYSGRKDQVAPQPNLLLIAQPDTPGLSCLPGTIQECARIRRVLPDMTPTLLVHEGATVQRTLNVMAQHPWVHLACHGKQDTTDPTKSAFALYDGPLTLLALMNTVADDAELAFLSACQTAVGDEKIPEESAHLAAGMLVVGFKGVIATMWSIGDEDAPVVAEAYYKKLIELRSSGAVKAGTGAAYALHEAVKALREKVGEQNVVKWAPFVHFGV
ncbi:unnamed protein product [Peniophora sp. CBMAI 1063]|nr:unnamed protein product [Peniophora sp. CBMAI 1063]